LQIKLTDTQYTSLLNIYGPPANVHDMIMCSANSTLNGDEDDFNDLMTLIGEEIGEGLCSVADTKRLRAIAKKVDPSSVHWIGM
jgi:hypothetical protein